MMGSWNAIAADLTNLQKMVDQDIRTAVGAVATIEDNKLIEKWNDLATAGTSDAPCIDAGLRPLFLTSIPQSTSIGRPPTSVQSSSSPWTTFPSKSTRKLAIRAAARPSTQLCS